jgi:hypothetical protein
MFPMPKQVEFSADEIDYLHIYMKNKIEYISAKSQILREELLPKWVRNYKGIPAEEEKTFPWPGASNLVVQLIGTHCDELLSRVMAIYMTDPLVVAKLLGDFDSGTGDDQREMLEIFYGDMALEPSELDLYRVEETWWSSAIKYGTGIVKFPWETVTEKQGIYIGGGTEEGTKTSYSFKDLEKRDGPHPENVPLNLWGVDPKFANQENADFVFHILRKDKYKLDEMYYHPEIFNPEALDKIKTQSDRDNPDQFSMELQGTKRYGFTFSNECANEWDIHECWFQYPKDGETYSLIGYFHLKTNTLLGVIYNVYPENDRAFEDAKLAYDDETYYGYGFCEMLESYQREVSDIRNWKLDNKRFSTTGVGRVNKNSKLSSIIQLFPGVFIPADQGEIEPLAFGTQAIAMDSSDEEFTLRLAASRAGVEAATGGSGGGIVNSKRGVYSSQGTAMVMQQQNNRNSLRMSDMRAAHVKLARKILRQYSYFGVGKKIRSYGNRAEVLTQALANYKDKKLGLVIKPATGSLNKELEKQNDILLSSTLERLYAGDAQLVQTLSNPVTPPEMKEYFVEVLKAKNSLMKHILRNFGHDDTDRLIPVPQQLKEQRNATLTKSNGNAAGANQASQGQSQGPSLVPVGGGQDFGGVPTATPQ